MKCCQVAFTGAAILHIPLTLFPSREQIYIYYKLKRTKRNHFLLTAAMTLIAVIVPCVYPDIVNLLGLLGGITVGGSGYILPLTLKLVSMKGKSWLFSSRFIYLILLLAILFLAGCSVYLSLIGVGGGGH